MKEFSDTEIAIHEAGHAVLFHFAGSSVQEIRLQPDKNPKGFVRLSKNSVIHPYNSMLAVYAGDTAVAILNKTKFYGYQKIADLCLKNDKTANRIATDLKKRTYIGFHEGCSSDVRTIQKAITFLDHKASKMNNHQPIFIAWQTMAVRDTKKLLWANWFKVIELATALLDKRVLKTKDIQAILN